jgi:hypothetical protein
LVRVTKAAKATIAIALLVTGIGLSLFFYFYQGSIFQPDEPPIEEPTGPLGYNATVTIRTPTGADISLVTEVRLWQTYNYSNITCWSWVDVSKNWSSTEFWHDGWINSYFFNWNLTGRDALNRSVIYYLEVQAWWMLDEWITGAYAPPSWWVGSLINMTEDGQDIRAVIEEGETCVTWQQAWAGNNVIDLISEPYMNYFSITNTDTLQNWQTSDGYYEDGYKANFRIRIKNPVNESRRGYNQQFDYLNKEWHGCWLIASSDNESNIVNYYTDMFGSDFLKWFNVTTGWWYAGTVFNNSITGAATYDCAMLLPTFSYDYEFYADIQILNGASGIHFFLGEGPESNIQIVTAL